MNAPQWLLRLGTWWVERRLTPHQRRQRDRDAARKSPDDPFIPLR